MEFLAILIALAVMQLRGSGAPFQGDAWFQAWRARVAPRLQGIPRQLALILLPALVVLLLQRAAAGRLFGVAELILCIVALLYSFGRGNLATALTDYLHRWSRGDFQAAFQQLNQEAASQLPEQDAVAHPQALHELARKRLYYRSFERVLAALFWFFVLGPAGAVAYRLAVLEHDAARHDAQPAAEGRLLHWLEWLPARLAGISFALVGHFDDCLYAWQRVLTDTRVATVDVLQACGGAALLLPTPADEESTDALIGRGTRELQAIENLFSRALLVWLAIIAALVMIF